MNAVPEIADVVELQTWASNSTYSVSTLEEDLRAAMPTEDRDQTEALARQVFEVMTERSRLLGASYPFTHDGTTLTPTERGLDSSYLFCLGLTWLEDINNNLRTREFEAIVKAASEEYFRGNAVRIGAPWKTQEITVYGELLQLVTDLIPDIGPPTRTEAPGGGDAGWDIVVVNNFADKQFSRIIALGNCATGRSDWDRKGAETQPTMFWDFFTRPPQPYNICLTFLAVPFLMTRDDKLRKAGPNCITFDRMRLCEHAPRATGPAMAWLASQRTNALDLALA
jgi:hypothetical protein